MGVRVTQRVRHGKGWSQSQVHNEKGMGEMANTTRPQTRRSHTARLASSGLAVLLLFGGVPPSTARAVENPVVQAPTGEEDGGIKSTENFDFEAFINHDNVRDGTEPFDTDNLAGNDLDDHNKVVRSFDTVTYPMKITINPKKVDKLENIKLRLTGTLEGGIEDGRANGRFAVGGTENLATGDVSFTQEYTIQQTGNSVMLPVTVEVLGAKPNAVLKPKLKVEVVSVDGVAPNSPVVTTFNDLPSVTVSARVNIRPLAGAGLAGQGIPYYPYSAIQPSTKEKWNTHAMSVTWSADKLPGKTDLRGSTFPDPKGKIKYRIVTNGFVTYDAAPTRTDTVQYDFLDKDLPVAVLDHQEIYPVSAKVGAPGSFMEGIPYSYRYGGNYTAPRSKMKDFKKATIDDVGYHSVWDSGQWTLGGPQVTKSQVIYEGENTGFTIGSTFPYYRADGWSGSPLYQQDIKAFSSHAFLIRMSNEYRINGPLNKANLANNAYYRATVVLDKYIAPNGDETLFNKSSSTSFDERNNPNGSYSVQNTFFAYPSGRELGTPNIGWSEISKGDASTLVGENVHLNTALGSSVMTPGGFRALTRWNTDSFELTPAFAKVGKDSIMAYGYYDQNINRVVNDAKTQEVLFGVAKFPKADNEWQVWSKKGIDDYDWYKTYDEAVKHGPVGSLQNNVTAPAGPKWTTAGRIPLRVKHENIGVGSINKDGTHNLSMTNYYPYADEERTVRSDVTAGRTLTNPAYWDKNGTMVEKQKPSGSTVPYETLGIQPAFASSVIDSDKATYYNSETVHWTVKNSLVLPTSGLPDAFDTSVQVTQKLPKGLTYKPGSGVIGTVKKEPVVTKNPDGTTSLMWDILFSLADSGKVDTVQFDTTINPFALSSGVQSSLDVTNVIATDLDQRPVKMRTTSKTITVLKVGMVGIYETIDKQDGKKNSAFELTLEPYTTIEDERDVTGLTNLPQDGDDLGSTFDGTAKLSDISIDSTRKYSGDVDIYLNDAVVKTTRPHEVDTTADGWYKYDNKGQDLSGVKTLLFKVDGLLANTDDVKVRLALQTKDNQFGNVYFNETVINSATDYKLSPMSNRVRYTIRADLELALERVRAYTWGGNQPVSVRVAKTVINENAIADENITLGIYETETNKRLVTKTYKPDELLRENVLSVPRVALTYPNTKPAKLNIEARIENVNTDTVWVRDGDEKLNVDIYKASQANIADDMASHAEQTYKGVTVAEREHGKPIQLYYETATISKTPVIKLKAGYGFAYQFHVTYANEILADVQSKLPIKTSVNAGITLDERLLDGTYKSVDDTAGGMSHIYLDAEIDATYFQGTKTVYNLPNSYIEQKTGNSYTQNQMIAMKADMSNPKQFVEGGKKFYVPVWIDEAMKYDIVPSNFGKTVESLGSNQVGFMATHRADIYAYMFNHTDSETSNDDELLIQPMTGKMDGVTR